MSFSGSTSSSPAESISSLVLNGDNQKELAKLLSTIKTRARTASIEGPKTTRIVPNLDELRNLVDGLLNMMRDANGAQSSGPFPRDSVDKVRPYVVTLLEQLIEDDHSNSKEYVLLMNRLQPRQQQSQLLSQSQSQLDRAESHSSDQLDSGSSEERDFSDEDLEDIYSKLSNEEKQCLMVLSLLPEGGVVSKTELIHWCIGLGFDLGENALVNKDNNPLHKLVEKGFITLITTTPVNLSKKYMITSDNIRSYVQRMTASTQELQKVINQFEYLTVPTHGEASSSVTVRHAGHHDHDQRIIALLNVKQKMLGEDTLALISEMKHAKVVHLGSWNWQKQNQSAHHPDYIVVRSVKSLGNLFLQLKEVKYLSLRGVWKLVRLPESVSNLDKLLILDLRACHNLRSLPQGIRYMGSLTHLDLSECYVLEHIPIEICFLLNLKVFKGFIINVDPQSRAAILGSNRRMKWCKKKDVSSLSSCPFSKVSCLEKLEKLTIRTRRMGFPTKEDLDTLCQLPLLHNLGITWVGSHNDAQIDSDLQEFPKMVNKLVLDIAPHQTASRLLELISEKKDCCLNKLYIRGGGLQGLNSKKHCLSNVKIVRFRYLSNFDVEWDQFKESFPDLTRLEVFECPYLAFFPCDDNGIWEELE